MNLPFGLPHKARLLGDKGYISADDTASIEAETGVRLVASRRKNIEATRLVYR